MLKLERLVLAMAEQEGWQPINPATGFAGSASYRRHNPLNLRASPFSIATENGYCVFKSDADGYAAAEWDIRQKALGNTRSGLTGNSTLRDFIRVWAPTEDGNNPESYLQNVLTHTGFKDNMVLSSLLDA